MNHAAIAKDIVDGIITHPNCSKGMKKDHESLFNMVLNKLVKDDIGREVVEFNIGEEHLKILIAPSYRNPILSFYMSSEDVSKFVVGEHLIIRFIVNGEKVPNLHYGRVFDIKESSVIIRF